MHNKSKINFKPLPFLSSGKWQTILGSFGFPPKPPPSEQMIVKLPDGDQLVCSFSTPPLPVGIIILVHGLGGSENSHYMLRMNRKLHDLGFITVRVNLRGCGPGETLARVPHSAACSNDLRAVLEKTHEIDAKLPIQMVGFSLGGHLVLKFLGDEGDRIPSYLTHTIAVCPAVEPADTVRLFALPNNQIFEQYYVKGLVKMAKKAERIFPEFGKTNFPKGLSIYEYDKIFTAPRWGFSSPEEYYSFARSSKVLKNIKVPCDVLYSLDDPIVNPKCIDTAEKSSLVTLHSTTYGGHMGFLGYVGEGFRIRFMDKTVIEWIKKAAAREGCGQGGIWVNFSFKD